LNLRSYHLVDSSLVSQPPVARRGRKSTTLRFANNMMGNVGAAMSMSSDYIDEDGPHSISVPATAEEIANNPLSIGLEEDLGLVVQEAGEISLHEYPSALNPN